uniref:Serpentine receptor class gamma n=1 Tax=Steinernema glaseri TaxID=37863 RepID=A0A1I7YTM9_9BILA
MNDSGEPMVCPEFYAFDDIFAIATPVINLALITFVLYSSYRIKSSDISRLYTVFLFFSYIPAEIAGLYYAVLSCTGGVSKERVFFPDG